jgi:predicted transcriptional regulator
MEGMMKGKLDALQVRKMMQSGMSKAEIARYFKVSKSAVTQLCQKNNININTQLIKDKKVAKAVVRRDQQVLNQIESVLSYGESMVGLVAKAAHGDEEALRHLDALGVKDKLAGFSRITNDFVNNIKQYMEIHKIAFDVQHTMNFQEAIIDCIREEYKNPESKETMDRLIQRLRKNKILRQLLKN